MTAAVISIKTNIFTWTRYAKIAYAAIERHRIEAPFRAQFRAAFPDKKCTMSFGHLLLRLADKGLIDMKKTRKLEQRYHKLSKLLHG